MLGRCDVILSVDLDAKDFFNAPWQYPAAVVAVNTIADTQRYIPAQHQVVGDIAEILQTLAPADGAGDSAWTTGDVTDYRATIRLSTRWHCARG